MHLIPKYIFFFIKKKLVELELNQNSIGNLKTNYHMADTVIFCSIWTENEFKGYQINRLKHLRGIVGIAEN